MYDTVESIATVMAQIDELTARKNRECDELIEILEILERNSTVGITLEDGKRLVHLGIDIDLDEFTQHRLHVGNESLLTDSGKTGLYGLAIGALIAVLGFILTKLFKWFKGTSSSSGSGEKSNKELAKEVPSMSSNPSNVMRVPSVLADADEFENFTKVMEEFLEFADDLIQNVAKDSDVTDKDVDAYRGKLIDALKKVGYKASGSNFVELLDEVKNTKLESLPYGKLKTEEVFINAERNQISSATERVFNETKADLEKLAKSKASDAATLKILKPISNILSKVLAANFIKAMQISGRHNTYLNRSVTLYAKAFGQKNFAEVANHETTKKFFTNVDYNDADSCTKAYEKVIAANLGGPMSAIKAFKALQEEIDSYQKDVEKIITGSKDKD